MFSDAFEIVLNLLNECSIEFNKKFAGLLDSLIEKDSRSLDVLVLLKQVLIEKNEKFSLITFNTILIGH